MCGSRRLYARSCAACDCVHRNVAFEQVLLCQGQEAELNTGCEATGVRNVTALAGGAAVKLGEAVNEIVLARLQAIVHREVNHLQLVGQLCALKELACVAVGGAEIEEVYLFKGHLVGEEEVGLSQQACVNIGDAVTGVAAAVYEFYLNFGVAEQQAYKLACCVSGTAYNSCFYH